MTHSILSILAYFFCLTFYRAPIEHRTGKWVALIITLIRISTLNAGTQPGSSPWSLINTKLTQDMISVCIERDAEEEVWVIRADDCM